MVVPCAEILFSFLASAEDTVIQAFSLIHSSKEVNDEITIFGNQVNCLLSKCPFVLLLALFVGAFPERYVVELL